MKNQRWLLLFWVIMNVSLYSQNKREASYTEIRKMYELKNTDDGSAMPYVNQYIAKAKKEKNNEKTVQGYLDAVQFSADISRKMIYSDSTIVAALKTGKNAVISHAYLGKGIVYYFSQKKFKKALDEYLKAQRYAEKTDDQYLKHKVRYHIAVVKNYLGYYDEAVDYFTEGIRYFNQQKASAGSDAERYNADKALLNSMHQLTVSYMYRGDFRKADSLIAVGMLNSRNNPDFRLEYAYFLKCRGLRELEKNNTNSALYYLEKALPPISKRKDFAWEAVINNKIGRIFWQNGDKNRAVKKWMKIDSLFTQYRFIVPETREAYEFLIMFYHSEKNSGKELYYTKNLLKADSILAKDFKYLSAEMYRKYDRKKLLDEKEKLESSKNQSFKAAGLFVGLAFILFIILIYRWKREKEMVRKFRIVQQNLLDREKSRKENEAAENEQSGKPKRSQNITEQKVLEISEKIKKFEKSMYFTHRGLTVNKVASHIGITEKQLSVYINDHKGMNFNRYMMELRINYITERMNTDKEYLKYDVTALGNECGYLYRQRFSDAFLEINGIRPADFLRIKKARSQT